MLAANWCGDAMLLWLVFNGLFLWAPIYNQKKEMFDKTCDAVCVKLGEMKKKVDEVIPKYKE